MIDNLKKNIMDFFRNDENSRSDFILPGQQSDVVFARKIDGRYTFGIPGGDYLNFYEEFNSCILATGLENNKPYLYFSCRELSEEFVTFCLTSFIPKEKREEITSDPAAWFEKISSIFGNSLSSTATSDKIAELYVFWQMKHFGLNITFGGYNTKSLRDIQCEGFEVEIKSTLNHHVWPIHTNPEQIGNKKEKENYYLVLCRLEKTETPIGENCYSLNSLKNELRNYSGCEDMLSKLPRSTSLLNQMYIIRDIKVFTVDENFPSVTLSGESNGAVLKNFVFELNPDVLNAKTLEDFLLEKGGKAPEAEEVEEVVSFEQDEEDKITQNDEPIIARESCMHNVTDDNFVKTRISRPRGDKTCRAAAIRILKKERRLMSAKEIVECIIRDNEYRFDPKAKTPWDSVASRLTTYINDCERDQIPCEICKPEKGKFKYAENEDTIL